MTKRVVVTAAEGLCPLGNTWEEVRENLLNRVSKIRRQEGWDEISDLKTRLGASVEGFERPAHYTRKKTRTMGRTSLLATRATELALQAAGLLNELVVENGVTGIAYGSTSGSPPAIETYARKVGLEKTLSGISGAEYIKSMSHTVAANVAQFFGVKGRLIPTCSACTSGSQGIGLAYESIKFGRQEVMIAGGSEELHVMAAAVFDIMFATSTRNDTPESVPRPFDRDRDGLVVGEGAATLILESLEHATGRGATILAEVVGFATSCDGDHMVNPSTDGMKRVQEAALADAGLTADAIDYVNAHGTATEVGDIAESQATASVFGRPVPITSLKSYMGHTLGACGAIEAWLGIRMMNEDWIAPTINLDVVDPRCGPLDYIREIREQNTQCFMSNNFAFGGVNTSLIFKRWPA